MAQFGILMMKLLYNSNFKNIQSRVQTFHEVAFSPLNFIFTSPSPLKADELVLFPIGLRTKNK